MAFNALTYHCNKYRRNALANLAAARDIKARVASGDAYDWEQPRIAMFVKLARIDWRLHLSIRASLTNMSGQAEYYGE